MAHRSSLWLAAALCVGAAAPAFAQTAAGGIPNGLSGPGGTETFHAAPAAPAPEVALPAVGAPARSSAPAAHSMPAAPAAGVRIPGK